MDFLRPVLARLIASVVAGLATYLYTKYGYQLDNESQAAVTSVLFTIFGVVYAVVHKAVNSKINPVDAARVSTAVTTKVAADNVADASVSHIDDVATKYVDVPPTNFTNRSI